MAPLTAATSQCIVFVLLLAVPAPLATAAQVSATQRAQRLGWVRVAEADGLVPPESRLQIRLALRRPVARLAEAVAAVSAPTSPRFRQYLTIDELAEVVRPSAAHREAVDRWLEAAGCVDQVIPAATADYLHLSLSVECAQTLFGVRMALFRHTDSGALVVRTTDVWAPPAAVADAISLVSGLDDFLPRRPRDAPPAGQKARGQFKGMNVDPGVIRRECNISVKGGVPAGSPSQAVAEFEEAYFYMSDIGLFLHKYGLPASKPTVFGPNHPNTGDLGEATLDVEYIMGVAPGVPTKVISIPSNAGFDLIGWALNVSAFAADVAVHSISWGSPEQSYDDTWMRQVDGEFQKLATLGVSVLVASGDDGTGGTGVLCKAFQPTFPASSPHVTAVGATYLQQPGAQVCWSYSGGGFSTVFPRPAWQASAVAAYLAAAGGQLPPGQLYNGSGRALPDVSALGTNYQILVTNFTGPISGTSAATPTFAAVVSLVNAKRKANGESPLGFLNPWLYSRWHSGRLGTDIVTGNNKHFPCSAGFPAIAGYDACSGLGTPDYGAMAEAV